MKLIRTSKGLSQQEVANHLGITQQAYANYERSVRQADYETLKKIADLFDATIDYLLGRADVPATPSLDEQLEGIDFALFDEVKEMTDEQKQDILDYIQYKKSKSK